MTGRGFFPTLVALVLLLTPMRTDAADLDSALAAYNRGDYALAFKEWKELSEKGDADAQYNLALMYEDGEGVARDYSQALYWYRRSADQGNARAKNNIGALYANGNGVGRDYVEALRWYQKAAAQGHVIAQRNVGNLYYDGHGVARDYGEAAKWYRKAADQGDSEAQLQLGYMYDTGQSVAQDPKEAMRWYRKAADQGNARAQNNIGALYEDARGVGRDYAEALRWYKKAAAQGDSLAQRNVGDLYYDGNGVVRDYGEAVKSYRKAAEQGDADAQLALGAMLEKGLGLAKDNAQALQWYRKAAAQGNEKAKLAVARLGPATASPGTGATTEQATPAADANFSQIERKAIQHDLAALGLYSGRIDGSFGPRTREAIRAFQRANKAEATGYLTIGEAAALAQQAATKQGEAEAKTQPVAAATSAEAEQSDKPPAITIPDDLEPIDRLFTVREPLNVRTEAKLAAGLAATLAPGDSVTVLGKVPGKNWYLVGKADAPLGYVANIEVDPAPGASAAGATTDASPSPPETTLVAAMAPYADISFGRYYALVIGNNEYKIVPKLRMSVKDAQAVADLLQHRYGFEVETLLDATRDHIIASLSALRKRLTAEDNLLIYYAGHGVYDEAADQGYWLPVDADRDTPANWVSNADITDMIKAMQAKHVMIVADSCYSGTLTRGLSIVLQDAGYIRRMAGKRGRTVLTSGGLEPVLDAGGGGHSVFARAFIDVLTENAGVLDGQQLFARVREPVTVNAEQTPEYGSIRFAGHDGGDFIFVRRN